MTRWIPGWAWRWLRPRHTIWPTRDGWWCLAAAMGLGLAAVNTGNNLVYLLCSMLLALIVVSGVLSEQTMRGLALTGTWPEEIYAGRPALFGVSVGNEKRWLASHQVALELLDVESGERVRRVARLAPGAERILTWETTLPRRGRRRLRGVRLTTRFPFGLFLKTGRRTLDAEVLVFPAVRPMPPERWLPVAGEGDGATRRRGRGHDLHDLRQYQPGDDPRLIHWRVSARAQTLTVRELEEDSALDTRLVLVGRGAGDSGRLEAGLSEAASLALGLIETGAGVEVVGTGIRVPLGRGRGHARRLLTALALYDPAVAAAGDGEPVPAPGIREIRIALD